MEPQNKSPFFLRTFKEELRSLPVIPALPMRVSVLCNLLEHASTLETLSEILQILLLISQRCLEVLKSNFLDIVDVLVGWFLDVETDVQTRDLIKEFFQRIGPLWVANASFTCDLLTRFETDITSTIQAAAAVFGRKMGGATQLRWSRLPSSLMPASRRTALQGTVS
eukprot:RCo018529